LSSVRSPWYRRDAATYVAAAVIAALGSQALAADHARRGLVLLGIAAGLVCWVLLGRWRAGRRRPMTVAQGLRRFTVIFSAIVLVCAVMAVLTFAGVTGGGLAWGFSWLLGTGGFGWLIYSVRRDFG
jgi:phosphotransferase system  glucose/maltose/N-acetylglucosamine-specific IIC component